MSEDRKARFAGKKQNKNNWKPQFKAGQEVLVKEVLFEGEDEWLSRGPFWGKITRIDPTTHLYYVLDTKNSIVSMPCTEDQIVGER